ncbi:unnamed protein product [Chironomus riparius]|uniref:Uncharacterized protein n=1 Tax=Chironomus riparius TaxID=315576 RepID=A0A9N9RQZ4_9DIPT|nr:unnamed protein product [Chironomus riparius]
MSKLLNLNLLCLIVILNLNLKFASAYKCEFKNTKYWVGSYYSCNILPNSNKAEKHFAGKNDNDVKAVVFYGGKLGIQRFSKSEASFFDRFQTLNSISVNAVKSIDGNSIQKFGDLKVFELANTEVRELPENFFSGNSKLHEIILTDNKLTSLPENIFANLKELKFLRLEKNQLNDLPANIFKPLKKIKILSLEGNKIQTLNPAWFEPLGHLEKLVIGYNQISDLPKNIFSSLVNLDFLAADFNRLTTIHADSFGDIKELYFVTFSDNKINAIDGKIVDIFKLDWLGVDNNVCIKDFIFQQATAKQELKACFDNYQPRNQ